MADVSDTEHGDPTVTPEQQLANADPRPFLTGDWLAALESRLATQAEAAPNSTAAAVIREALGKTSILVIGLAGPNAKPIEKMDLTDLAVYWWSTLLHNPGLLPADKVEERLTGIDEHQHPDCVHVYARAGDLAHPERIAHATA